MGLFSTLQDLRRRPLVETSVALVLVAVVGALLARELRDMNYADVLTSLGRLGSKQLLLAFATTILAYTALATYDLLAVWQSSASISPARTMLTSFISYAFNFNLGSLVGAVAMRLRLYGRFGASKKEIGGIMLFCIVTGWIGFSLLAGGVFLAAPPELPERFGLKEAAVRPLGVLGLAVAATYVALCRLKTRPLRFKDWTFKLPHPRIAALQLLIGGIYWSLAAWTIFQLLPADSDVSYAKVLGIYLIAAIAALMAHIPAGLGVLEGTFVVLLAPSVPKADVLATMLAFRGVFYLAPLALAALTYTIIEVRYRHGTRSAKSELTRQHIGSEPR